MLSIYEIVPTIFNLFLNLKVFSASRDVEIFVLSDFSLESKKDWITTLN
jgi:hypothetical protein